MAKWVNLDDCVEISAGEMRFYPVELLGDVYEEVAPVVHGSWIKKEDCSVVTDIPWSMCSACGSYSLKLPYCAFCGAKMDEE